METTQQINQLSNFQKDVLGYERYKVRSILDRGEMLHWVDAYTRSGLMIRTKYAWISDSKLSMFIDDTIAALRACAEARRLSADNCIHEPGSEVPSYV